MTNADKLKQILKDIEKNEMELRHFLASIQEHPYFDKSNKSFSLDGLVRVSERLLNTQEKLNQEYKP